MTQSKKLDEVQEAVGGVKQKRMRPSECRGLMRRTLQEEFQGIVDGFIAAAKMGSCPHVKLATELLMPIRKPTSRKKGTATKYWEMLQKEDREKARVKEQLAPSERGTLEITAGFSSKL